jgi:hypothetical protein
MKTLGLAFVLGLLAADLAWSAPVRFLSGAQVDLGAPSVGPAQGADPALARADLDRDGKLDLVLAQPFDPGAGLLVAFGDGNGTFAAPRRVSITGSPSALVVGDLDGDGIADVLASMYTPDTPLYETRAFFGNGNGTFRKGPVLAGGRTSAAIGDFDGDGLADVALAFADEPMKMKGMLQIYRGDGAGQLVLVQELPRDDAGAVPPRDLHAVDLDQDGDLDLVLGPRVSAFLNKGGLFGDELVAPDELDGEISTVGDFNADDVPDVAVAGAAYAGVRVGLGIGDGGFKPADASELGVLGSCRTLLAGDFDGDKWMDLLVGDGADGVILARGTGAGDFKLGDRLLTGGIDGILGDFDRDGRLDLAAAGVEPGAVTVTRARAGGFDAPVATVAAAYGEILAAGDVNGDGMMDLVASRDGQPLLSVHLGRRGGGMDLPIEVPVSHEALALAVGDHNGDGLDDVVLGCESDDGENVEVMAGTPSGVLVSILHRDNGSAAKPAFKGLAIADVNGDGAPDVISSTEKELSVLPNRKEGVFGEPIVSGVSRGEARMLIVRDFDGDGFADVASIVDAGAYDPLTATLLVNFGTGDGKFRFAQSVSVPGVLPSAAALRFDGDAAIDLAVSTMPGGADKGGLVLLRNKSGRFELIDEVTGAAGGNLSVADLDGDGADEILTSADGDRAGVVQVFRNDGNDRLWMERELPAPGGPHDLVIADVAGNALPDLVMLDATNQRSRMVSYVNVSADYTILGPIGGGVDPGMPDPPILRSRPNPFRRGTTVQLAAGMSGDLRVQVVDVAGRIVRSMERVRPAGASIRWDGLDDAGRAVGTGLYFIRVHSAAGVATARVVRMP